MNVKMRGAVIGGAVLLAVVVVMVALLDDAGAGEGPVISVAPQGAPAMGVPDGLESTELPVLAEAAPAGLEFAEAPEQAAKVSSPEPALVIRGLVLAPNGTPVEGAVLVLSKDAQDAPALDTQLSNSEGRFRFEFQEHQEDAERLSVTAEGFAPMSMSGTGFSDEEFEVRLHWTATVSGVVRDVETGAPVARALVSSGRTPVETASDGSYSLDGVLVGWESGITVQHEDYAREVVSFLLKNPEAVEVDVELERGVLVECSVVDRQSGEPVQGAEIRRYVRGDAFAKVDGSGRFNMRLSKNDGEGDRSITVTHPDYCPLQWSWQGDDVAPGLSPRLPLERPAWIDVRLVDVEGELVQGAGVYASLDLFPAGRLPPETLAAFGLPGSASDGDPSDALPPLDDLPGVAQVPVLPSEKDYTLSAWHPDYVSAKSEPLQLRLPDGRVSVDLVLHQGGSIVGCLMRDAEPLDFVEVRCTDAQGKYLGRGYTSQKGEFALKNLRVGEATLTVQGVMHGQVLYEAVLTVEAGRELVHDIALETEQQALDTLEGRVAWANGEAVTQKGVGARVAGNARGLQIASTQTDETGAYVLEVPAGGVYDVWIPHVTEVLREAVPAGSRGVNFVLPLISTFTLVLRDVATGEPVQGEGSRLMRRWLSWRQAGALRFRTTTTDIDIHGKAALELPVGAVDLAIDLESDGFQPLRLHGVSVPELPSPHPYEVLLQKGAEVDFQLVDVSTGQKVRPADHLVYVVPEAKRDLIRQPAEGERAYHRINGVEVLIEDPELGGRRLKLREEGKAVQGGLEPGRYYLMAFPPDLVLEPASFTIPRAADEPLEVRWAPLGG